MDFFKNFVEKYGKIVFVLFAISFFILIFTPQELKIYTTPLALLAAFAMFIVFTYTVINKDAESPRRNNALFYIANLNFVVVMSKFLLPEHYYFYWEIAVGFAACPFVLLILYIVFKDGFFQKEA